LPAYRGGFRESPRRNRIFLNPAGLAQFARFDSFAIKLECLLGGLRGLFGKQHPGVRA